ncbi:methyl-galactoside transport system substrate-binding protein [Clostridium algifaecis]|uniref:D-galactose/methyl-galactoside binding periplasmic protein MglB n=1 Tax=Clostridium algifaecis TaxID=1472040 RepID=A0ABS4KTH7_9CLOT|nr:galactose ABC transporter substrate-binding protein [Clostridium algifaecis]MBP2033358.1 methyl-galactoside transport system substrate-binding protein [Clostridium algifaecis]
MNKHIKVIIINFLIIICFLMGCQYKTNKRNKPIVGVVVARFDDTFLTSVRNQFYDMAQNKVEVDIWNGNGSQKTENEKVDILIKSKVNVLAVNLVDTNGASSIIEKAKKANIPVIFFNTEPSAEDLEKWDKVYYVGSRSEQSGIFQGQMLVNYFKSNPAKNGTIRYVMLEGKTDHPDAIARTKYSVKTIEDAGFKVQNVAQDTAMWDREEAEEKMANILAVQNDNIDCVIANNDDMALGAIDALKSKGYFNNGKYIPVVGVDDTDGAANAEKAGTLLGTVLNDAKNQGKAIFNLASVLSNGQAPDSSNFTTPINDGKYIWIDNKIVTK